YQMLLVRQSAVSLFFFFSSRRRHTRFSRDWSSDVCSSDLEAPLFRRHQQLVIGQAAPQEERQARRELEIADPPSLFSRPIVLGEVDEMRAHEYRAQLIANAGLEIGGLAARLVEDQQLVDVLHRQRAAERRLGEIRDDLLRAIRFLGRVARLADESLLARRRVADAGDRQRAAELLRVDAVNAILAAL